MSTATCRHGHDCHINAVQGTCMVSARLSRQVQQPAASNRRSRGCRRHPFHPGRCRRAVRETRADAARSLSPTRRRRRRQPLPNAKPAPHIGASLASAPTTPLRTQAEPKGQRRCAVQYHRCGIYWAAAVTTCEREGLPDICSFVLRFKWTLA